MPVFKSGQNDYQLDFSYRTSDRLRKLDSAVFADLSGYLKDKFSWLFTATADYPVLKTGFVSQEDAEKADQQLHSAISEWLKRGTGTKPQKKPKAKKEKLLETKKKESSDSKWILISVINNDIYADEFDTFDAALDTMKHEYDKIVEDWDDAYFTSDYASIRTECDNFDWKIIRVDF